MEKLIKEKTQFILKNKIKTIGLLSFALIMLTLIGLIAKVVYEALNYVIPMVLLGGLSWFTWLLLKKEWNKTKD